MIFGKITISTISGTSRQAKGEILLTSGYLRFSH